MTQNKLKSMLGPTPIQKGKPLGLSTEEGENTPSQQRTNASDKQQPKRTKRGYALREDLVKNLKRIALEEDRTLYEVMEEAMEEYLVRKRESTPS